MTSHPLVTISNHPEYGTFDAEQILTPRTWPWWLVRRLDGDGSAHDLIGVHFSYVKAKED